MHRFHASRTVLTHIKAVIGAGNCLRQFCELSYWMVSESVIKAP